MPYSPNIEIWQGSGSFFPLTFTPFGFYDDDSDFQEDAEAIAKWAAIKLGFPIVSVELQEINFYSAFEEAVNEYGAQLNTFQARDQLLNLSGQATGSYNLSQKYISPTLKGIFKLASAYGTEVGAGGTQKYYTGSINLIPKKQVYDLSRDTIIETGSFATDEFTIRKIFHEPPPAVSRIMDPTLGTSAQTALQEFGWAGFGSAGQFLVMPVYHDILRAQAVEFNQQIRRSGYSFQLTGNRLRIFPIPNQSVKLWFYYSLDAEAFNSESGRISDVSNIPYQTVTYKFLNEMARQWIRKYALALVKEMLGYVRIKYSAIPIPDGEITLNGADLVAAGKESQDALVQELKDMLDSMSYQAQLERRTAIATNLNGQLKFVPLKIYIKILIPFIIFFGNL